jgi:hypothetical protein
MDAYFWKSSNTSAVCFFMLGALTLKVNEDFLSSKVFY